MGKALGGEGREITKNIRKRLGVTDIDTTSIVVTVKCLYICIHIHTNTYRLLKWYFVSNMHISFAEIQEGHSEN